MRILIAVGGIILVVGILWYFFASGPSIANYPPKNDTIVAFGDSLVFGTGATVGNDFVSLLSAKMGAPIINLGVPGNTTEDGLSRLQEVKEKDPGMVILLLGGNDYLRKIPEGQTFQNLRTIIAALEKGGAVVVLLGVRGGVLRDTFEDQFETLGEETGVIFVPNVLSGLFGNMTYMSDAIHPNDKGYARIAERVYETIEKYR